MLPGSLNTAILFCAARLAFGQDQITRLAPVGFPQLPPAIRLELSRRSCSIPQAWGQKTPNNVIKGHFFQAAELDYAVLCSANHTSSILIFRNGAAQNVTSLAPHQDNDYLQGVGGNQIGYSRLLQTAGRALINEEQSWEGGKPLHIPISHQGINDVFVGKASEVHYFYRGKWIVLTGAD